MAILFHRPPRRFKKRQRNLQRQMDVSQLGQVWNLWFLFIFIFSKFFFFWLNSLLGGSVSHYDFSFFFFWQTLFPGLWLTEVTAETYKVPEIPENEKVNICDFILLANFLPWFFFFGIFSAYLFSFNEIINICLNYYKNGQTYPLIILRNKNNLSFKY